MGEHMEKLRARFEQLKAAGLEDVKFLFGPLSEKTLDEVCVSITEVLDEVDRGEYDEISHRGTSHTR